MAQKTNSPPFAFRLTVQSIPDFGSDDLRLWVSPDSVSAALTKRLERTFDASRLVELAAIAIAGFGLHYSAGHEIYDVALRGSGADYLVGHRRHRLEIAGRSNRRDLGIAWRTRVQRLKARSVRGFFVCAAEFESMSGRLGYFD